MKNVIRIENDIAYVSLTQGKEAKIDVEDIEKILPYRWFVLKLNGLFRPARHDPVTKKSILMHRELMETPVGEEADHINGDTLDNRRSVNLRNCLHSKNAKNRKMSKHNRVGFKGVSQKGNRFRAKITVDGVIISLGGFASAEEAHRAYVAASIKYHGDFGRFQ